MPKLRIHPLDFGILQFIHFISKTFPRGDSTVKFYGNGSALHQRKHQIISKYQVAENGHVDVGCSTLEVSLLALRYVTKEFGDDLSTMRPCLLCQGKALGWHTATSSERLFVKGPFDRLLPTGLPRMSKIFRDRPISLMNHRNDSLSYVFMSSEGFLPHGRVSMILLHPAIRVSMSIACC